MTMTDSGTRPILAYTLPADGAPRNATDEKWIKLRKTGLRILAKKTAEAPVFAWSRDGVSQDFAIV
ncbi:hypothetical protein [Bifidobacterium biavatii]|uniref:Uncharacterized protein n=1 Tax=Bifidobacterium biavatii DSM 23969 TaxID=1437608 RepID=A0A086ZWF6_9BIFI|nr:hypothetical protein [Bifidobacterium biavatii]KFI50856.1 hypothetical protein BBIA_2365 [Bifidobacterium biavatii DSM 23969]